MKYLPKVTLVAASDIKLSETIRSLTKSKTDIIFNTVKLFTSTDLMPKDNEIIVEHVSPITSSKDYSYFIMYELHKHITTEYCLITQHDGWVVNPTSWTDKFLQYDYIGAPWPSGKVGNGGFSLRSMRFLKYFSDNNKPFVPNGDGLYLEDSIITTIYGEDLAKDGLLFAPEDIANQFSRELYYEKSCESPFGFHSFRDRNFIYLNF